jgi:hypothetical protein
LEELGCFQRDLGEEEENVLVEIQSTIGLAVEKSVRIFMSDQEEK